MRYQATEPNGDVSEEDLQMIALFAEGLSVEAIARRFDLSERTVRRRARTLCDRFGARAMVQVVAWAARRGVI
ncbi:MAG: helix-turn-helix transcriptional regulator [Actinophytocola sp.]|nr:helix-turn-helix transcriptional regulator [Actinophytocola sp.]